MAIVRKALVKAVALEPKIKVVKDGSPTVVEVGEAVVYNIVIENLGTVAVKNFSIKDAIPTGMSLLNTFIINNGAIYPLTVGENIEKGLVIDEILGKTTASILYVCSVLSVPPLEFINGFQYSYEYEASGRIFQVGPITGNSVKADGVFDRIELEKQVRLAKDCYAPYGEFILGKPGQVLAFRVIVTNSLEVPIEGGILNDYIPSKLKLVPDSITVNKVPVKWHSDKLLNFPLGDLQPEESVIVTYRALVIEADGFLYTNYTAIFDSSLGKVGTESYMGGQIYSMDIVMRACPEVVVCGQVITYTILMNNGASEAMKGIKLVDVLPEALRFVPSSPCVDGDRQCDVKRIEDIRIPNLEPGCHHMISYKAFVDASMPYISNYATVVYIQGESPVGFNVNSNTVVVKVEKEF